ALLGQYASLLARLRVVARGVDPLVLSPLALQDIDVATPASRSVLALGTLSYLVLLTMLMGGMYLAIDATAGERERGSLEPLLTVPVRREALMFGKILATCAYMTASLTQHFLITSLLRDERVPAAYLAVSVSATLALGALLIGVAGGLYRREALLG